jgi:hypothetical protein
VAESTLKTLQHIIQDIIAPDVRDLKVRVDSLEKRMDERFDSLQRESHAQYNSILRENQAQYNSILAAISESRADSRLAFEQRIAPHNERASILEAQRN